MEHKKIKNIARSTLMVVGSLVSIAFIYAGLYVIPFTTSKNHQNFSYHNLNYSKNSPISQNNIRNADKKFLEGKLRPITTSEYEKWLEGYVENGNSPTHSYNYPFHGRDFFVATEDFEIKPLYGARSINIIVPENVNFIGGELGHNNLYFMDGHKNKGTWVPLFSNTKVY